jgi:hypothetical protein
VDQEIQDGAPITAHHVLHLNLGIVTMKALAPVTVEAGVNLLPAQDLVGALIMDVQNVQNKILGTVLMKQPVQIVVEIGVQINGEGGAQIMNAKHSNVAAMNHGNAIPKENVTTLELIGATIIVNHIPVRYVRIHNHGTASHHLIADQMVSSGVETMPIMDGVQLLVQNVHPENHGIVIIKMIA